MTDRFHVRAEGVTVHYRPGARRITALDDVTLQVPRSSFGLLKGASGSGKSTLLGVMGAIARPTAGRVFFGAQEMTNASPNELARIRRRIGFLFQNFALLERLTAWENIAVPLVALGIPHRERRKTAELLLSSLGLAGSAEARVTELSGGEQQRVAFARALAASPELLLADEPTASLDDENADLLARHLTEMHRRGVTVLLASHDPRFQKLATHTWTLKGGRLLSEAHET